MRRGAGQELFFLAFSVGIGWLAALGAVFFRTLVEFFQYGLWAPGHTFLDKVTHSPWWWVMLAPAAVGLAVGPILTFWVPEAKGPGVTEVILAVSARQSTIRHRVTALKALVTSLLIGGGASVGREGPIVQIGASIGSSMAQLLGLDAELRRVCLASGAAAGIAATFNAPIAGTLFAVEIILLDIEIGYISHIIIASISASVLSRLFWGEFPTFAVSSFHLAHYWELGGYLVLGVLAGLVAIGFVRLTHLMDGLFGRIPIRDWTKPALGGLLLGLLALRFPYVLGVGYETINLALDGAMAVQLAALVLAAKLLATALSIGSGMSGGIFAPSLVLGSALGTIVGLAFAWWLPGSALNAGNYALAGMGAVVAGTTLAPITAILTIFELTYSTEIILPLMVACIASTLVVKLLFGYSAYEMRLLKRGINIVRGHDVGILRSLHAKDFMHRDFEWILDSTSLGEIVQQVRGSPYPHFVVLNERRELRGMLSLRDLRGALGEMEVLQDLVIAVDLMTEQVVTLSLYDDLEKALRVFDEHRFSLLPVIDPWNPQMVVGVLRKDILIQAYHERVLKDRILSPAGDR